MKEVYFTKHYNNIGFYTMLQFKVIRAGSAPLVHMMEKDDRNRWGVDWKEYAVTLHGMELIDQGGNN